MKNKLKKQENITEIGIKSNEDQVSFLNNNPDETTETIDYKQKYEEALLIIEDLRNQIVQLQEMVNQLINKQFGKKKDDSSAALGQVQMIFDEVETFAVLEEVIEEVEEPTTTKVKSNKGRKLPSVANPNLKVVEIYHEAPEGVTEEYVCIGEEVQETIKYEPRKIWIEVAHFPTYVKRCEDGTDIILNDCSKRVFLPKSPVSPELVSAIINDKYNLALPLNRIEGDFENIGANISRQTMSNWVVAACDKYFMPIYEGMKRELLKKDIIHADETTVQVLHHTDGSTNIKSYMWMYRSSASDIPIILYEYQPGRGHEYPKAFLFEYAGYLQTDGYAAYQKLENITQIGCLAHGRRKIIDSLAVISDKKTESYQIGQRILNTINWIFSIDKKIPITNKIKDQKERVERLTPMFDMFYQLLVEGEGVILPKSRLGEAINYNINQFDSFKRVLLDPRLDLTNNIAERAIKPFVIGRKNWLFNNTTGGAKTSSVVYSIVQNAKANHLNVTGYLTYIFDKMSKTENWNDEFIANMLPISKSLPDYLYNNKKQVG